MSVYQIYILNIGDYTLSVYLILSLFSLMLAVSMVDVRNVPATGVLIPFIVIIIMNVVYIFLSPDVAEGGRSLVFSLPFGAIFYISYVYMSKNPNLIENLFTFYALMSVVQSILTILFIISPDLEMKFLYSQMAGIFVNPNTLAHLALTGSGNVLDVYKAGGFFDNGNLAAVYNEISASTAICAMAMARNRGKKLRSTLLFILFLVHYVSIFATGSKSGAVMAVSMPFMWMIVRFFIRNQRRLDKLALASLALFLFCFVVYYFSSEILTNEIIDNGERNAARRIVIWDAALKLFLQNPISGLGYGGWYENFKDYGASFSYMQVYGDMPAHNMLIIIWAETGLIPALMILLLMKAVFTYSKKFAQIGRVELFMASVISSVFICIFLHSMIDNFIFYREARLQLPSALLIAWMASWQSRHIFLKAEKGN